MLSHCCSVCFTMWNDVTTRENRHFICHLRRFLQHVLMRAACRYCKAPWWDSIIKTWTKLDTEQKRQTEAGLSDSAAWDVHYFPTCHVAICTHNQLIITSKVLQEMSVQYASAALQLTAAPSGTSGCWPGESQLELSGTAESKERKKSQPLGADKFDCVITASAPSWFLGWFNESAGC